MQNKDTTTTTTKTAYQQLKYQNQAWQHTLILTQFQTRSEFHFSTRYNSRGVLQNSAIHLLHSLIHPHKHTPKDTNLSLAWINFGASTDCDYAQIQHKCYRKQRNQITFCIYSVAWFYVSYGKNVMCFFLCFIWNLFPRFSRKIFEVLFSNDYCSHPTKTQ